MSGRNEHKLVGLDIFLKNIKEVKKMTGAYKYLLERLEENEEIYEKIDEEDSDVSYFLEDGEVVAVKRGDLLSFYFYVDYKFILSPYSTVIVTVVKDYCVVDEKTRIMDVMLIQAMTDECFGVTRDDEYSLSVDKNNLTYKNKDIRMSKKRFGTICYEDENYILPFTKLGYLIKFKPKLWGYKEGLHYSIFEEPNESKILSDSASKLNDVKESTYNYFHKKYEWFFNHSKNKKNVESKTNLIEELKEKNYHGDDLGVAYIYHISANDRETYKSKKF